MFEGEVVTSIECGSCRTVRERKEEFLDLMVSPSNDLETI